MKNIIILFIAFSNIVSCQTANEKVIDPDGEFTHFKFDGFSIGFSAVISGGTINSPILGGFKIFNSNSNLT